MQQISFGVFEEQNSSPSPRGFDQLVERQAFAGQILPGAFEGVDAQGQMTPAIERVIARFLEAEIAFIDLQHDPARQPEKERRRRLAICKDQLGPQSPGIPILQSRGIAGWQSDMFHSKFHGGGIAYSRDDGTENTRVVPGGIT